MKPMILIPLFSVLLISITGCVTYYNSSDIKKYFDSGLSMAEEAVTAAEKDFNDKSEVIAGIRKNISDPSMVPYPDFDLILQEMNSSFRSMKAQLGLMEKSREAVYRIIDGQKRIESDEDKYEEFLGEKDRFSDLFEGFNGMADRYEKESQKFNKMAESYSLVRVLTADIEKTFQEYKIHSDSQISKALVELDMAETQIDTAGSASFDSNGINEKRDILLRMRAIISEIERKRDELLILADLFNKEAGESTEYYVGPGMASYGFLDTIREKSAEISSLTNSLDDLAKQFGD